MRFSRLGSKMRYKRIAAAGKQIFGDGDVGTVLRAAGITLTIRIVATVVAYVSIVAFARWMGAAQYGAFTYALSWVFVLALPASLGMSLASVRFLPQYAALGAWGKIRGLLGRSVSLTVRMSLVVALVAIAVVLIFGKRGPPEYRAALIIALAGLPIVTLVALGSQVGRAFGWVVAGYSPSQLWQPLFLLLIAGSLVLNGTHLIASQLVILYLATAAAGVLAQAIIYARRLRPNLQHVIPEHEQRLWLRISIPLLMIDGFAALINYSDVLIIGIFLKPSAVAYYSAAARTASLVTFFVTSINALAGPRMAELYAKGDTRALRQLLIGIAPWITWPAAAVTVALIAGRSALPRLFGPGFEAAWLPLVLLAIGNLAASVTGPAGTLLNMTGHQDITAKVYAGSAAANVALCLILIPRLGLNGAALSTAITITVSSAILFVLAHRKLGLNTSILRSPITGSANQ